MILHGKQQRKNTIKWSARHSHTFYVLENGSLLLQRDMAWQRPPSTQASFTQLLMGQGLRNFQNTVHWGVYGVYSAC